MKLSTAVLAVTATVAAAGKTVSSKNAHKVLRNARLIEGSRHLDQNQQEEEENAFLGNYNMKFVSCAAGEQVVNPENGEYEYGAVIVRACPSSEGCDSDSTKGCKSGYGDYLVSVGTFVEAWFEDQRDNMQWDDQFNVEEYTECKEYDPDEANDDDNNAWENYQFFLGPTCTEDGDDVKIGLFDDQYCSTPSEYEFETISNGWSLPYGEGGLVSTSCQDCMAYNDNGEYELREMCERIYENSASKCETEMEYTSYYGANVNGCEYIEELLPKKAQSGRGGKILGWIILTLLVVGLIGYVMWWRKKKATTSA